MSSSSSFIIFLACSLILVQAALGEIICDQLPTDKCSFAIASSGKRCLLENYQGKDGKVEYQCRTSEVMVNGMSEHIESDKCVAACGVDRKTVGISSDAFFEPLFAAKLCSPACYQNCPNIIDLYFNLAAGEGVFLPALCDKQRTNPRRAVFELMSNGGAAPGPVSAAASEDMFASEPAPAPTVF